MRALVVLVVLGAAACGALYFFGDFGSFDPSEQGEAARKAITSGMTLAQVIAIAGEPREYRQMQMQKKKVDGVEVEFYKAGPPVKFELARVQDRILRNDLPHGFVLPFNFSRSVAFSVEFDGSGTAVEVSDLTTEADLLQTRD